MMYILLIKFINLPHFLVSFNLSRSLCAEQICIFVFNKFNFDSMQCPTCIIYLCTYCKECLVVAISAIHCDSLLDAIQLMATDDMGVVYWDDSVTQLIATAICPSLFPSINISHYWSRNSNSVDNTTICMVLWTTSYHNRVDLRKKAIRLVASQWVI